MKKLEHLNDIKNFDTIAVHAHFNTSCNIKHFSFFIVTTINDDKKRELKESYIIQKFNTIKPNGLNSYKNSSKDKINFILPYTPNTLNIANSIKLLCENNNIPTRLCYKNCKNINSKFRNY